LAGGTGLAVRHTAFADRQFGQRPTTAIIHDLVRGQRPLSLVELWFAAPLAGGAVVVTAVMSAN
jgi:hypothetical protein